MFKDRLDLYKAIEEDRQSKLLVYVTGDRKGLETQIHPEVLDLLTQHLDLIGAVPKITFYLYTRGGQTLAAWSIANLILQFCDNFEVIVPSKAHSSGTLICLGANNIIMTKQATLGPIDPSVNTPLNPAIPGAPSHVRYSVSVEAINGFIELAKTIGSNSSDYSSTVLSILASNVHPLVLGEVYRTRSQIRMLGKRLLSRHMSGDNLEEDIQKILSFLCSESGSHDYTIYRDEAKDELRLKVDHPNGYLYDLIQSVYRDISIELELIEPVDPLVYLGDQDQVEYNFSRALIESVEGGSIKYMKLGSFIKQQSRDEHGNIQIGILDKPTFQGWRNDQQ